MRRLAAELGVATAGLYRYFPDRDSLLVDMAELVLGQFAPPAADLVDWRDLLSHLARTEWRLYQRHPWILSVLARTRPPVGPALLDIVERYFAALDWSNIPTDTMMAVYLSLSGLVQGLALLPPSEPVPTHTAAPAAEAFRAQSLTLISPATHPALSRRFAHSIDQYNLDFEQILDYGLALLLDGVAARHLDNDPPGARIGQ